MVMFWNEKADKLLVPFLDKRDLIALGMGKYSFFKLTISSIFIKSIISGAASLTPDTYSHQF